MKNSIEVRKITDGKGYYFKPYYDMQPWSKSGRFFICMRSKFQERPPQPGDELELGVIDLEEKNKFIPVAFTRAWNFQQGCMPHWLPGYEDSKIIYNDIINNECFSFIVDISTGISTDKKEVFSLPIQAISYSRNIGASLNYARWGYERPGYGYAGIKDPFHGINQPENDSVHIIDLKTGKTEPVMFLKGVAALTSDNDRRKGSFMYFCHLIFTPDGKSLTGICRWWCPDIVDEVYKPKINIDGAVPERRHCLWGYDIDENKPYIVINDGLVSHASFKDDENIIVYASRRCYEPAAYHLINIYTKEYRVIGKDLLSCDGHMSYHKNKELLLTDTYPDDEYIRSLKIYNEKEDKEIKLGRFYAPPDLMGELRCDLHPCWSRDYMDIAIDSIHEKGNRNMYLVSFDQDSV
ncbi:MAG TPA: hypothetical protein PK733_07120 [Clostridiales bacterium]|nr:hypothetical protein [Clostridiales bacterium]